MSEQVRSRLTREKLKRILRQLPAVLAGKVSIPGTANEVRQILLALGMQALSTIRASFVEKSRGGTDEAGIKWKPLAPSTIARRRHGPALARKKREAAKKGRSSRPLLTDAQDKRWRAVYAYALKITKGDKAHAAAWAWTVLKAEGGKTILGQYGNAQVEILRDTGRMLNSLSPGKAENILKVESGSVSVGSNIPRAAWHHSGTDRIPARPLWPDEDKWPEAWRNKLLEVLGEGILKLAAKLASRNR